MARLAGGSAQLAAWRAVVCLGACVVAGHPAMAQVDSREGIALQNQILELKQEVQQMQQLQIQAGGQPSALPQQSAPQDYGTPPPQYGAPSAGGGDITAQLLVRVGALEEQVRAMHGRLEELANAQQHDHDELTKQIGDLAFKLGQGGSAAGGATSPAAGDAGMAPADTGAGAGMDLRSAAPPPPPPPTKRTAEVALKQGNAALARRDYPGAEAAAREVMAMPRGPHAPDAQYLLARALAGEHQYKPAAASYFAVYKASPKSPRGAEGLLGVANAMLGLGDNRDACEAVAKFSAEFPHAEAGLHQAAASVRKRAGCK
jgi:TolA-binding protein